MTAVPAVCTLRGMPYPDVVGTNEIAERAGVTRHAVNQWRRRPIKPPFPDPRWEASGLPLWDWELDIVPWLKASGRGNLIGR